MGVIKEFKEFIMRGNVVDLAIAVIIGAAFGAVITSLVQDIITPVLLKPALAAAGAASIETWAPGGILLGKFIAALLSFLVIAFVLFMVIKGMNATKKKEIIIAPATQEQLLTEIRDLLRNKQ